MTTQHEQDEAPIRQQIEKIIGKCRDKDLEGLKQIYAADVVSFDVEPSLQHAGIAAKLKNWEKALVVFQDVTYEVRDLTLTVGDEAAHRARLRPIRRHAAERDGDERYVGPGDLLHPQGRRHVVDRARPGFGVTDLEP